MIIIFYVDLFLSVFLVKAELRKCGEVRSHPPHPPWLLLPARVKGKVYKVAVRPAMLYGLETVALTKRQEAEMEVAELKMLRFSLGVTRMDNIRNEYIRGTA